MASTVKDAALSLRETVSCEDVIARLAPHVTLRKNGRGLAGPCPFCGGDDRFYITPDRTGAACTHCHDRRMDSVGLAAWILKCSQHEAVDVLSGHRPYSQLPAPPATPKTRRTDENNAYNATWRTKVAAEAQDRHYRLAEDNAGAASARSYLLSRGLAPDTWQAFTVGYQEKRYVTAGRLAPAISWPICTQDGSVYGVKYRFLEAQDVGKDKPLRYMSRSGSIVRDTGAMFGAQLLYADATRRYRCLVFCEGEINAMSIWQACNLAGVDVLSFGSDSQPELPQWAIDYASGYGCVATWLDSPDKSAEVASQLRHLPHVARLRSPLREDGTEADANVCLVDDRLGALVQSVRFQKLPPAQHESVVWQIWDARDVLDEAQVRIGQKMAERLGVSW